MTIWRYGDISRDGVWAADCLFCKSSLKTVFMERHDTRPIFKTNLSNHTNGLRKLQRCELCGWWKATDHSEHETTRPLETRHSVMGAAGSLKELDLQDIAAPLDAVRQYLLAKFEAGKDMHPRLFELTVGSVFRSLKYDVVITAYSGDGGIDAVLEKDGKQFGVQVKRYRNSINVEQIRAFVGSLLLKGITEGVFVTTSCFQAGAGPTVEEAAVRGYKVALMDAAKLYDTLKIAQLNETTPFDAATANEYFYHLELISHETRSFW